VKYTSSRIVSTLVLVEPAQFGKTWRDQLADFKPFSPGEVSARASTRVSVAATAHTLRTVHAPSACTVSSTVFAGTCTSPEYLPISLTRLV
jgi:hypothetical protein